MVYTNLGARGVVGRGTALQSSRCRVPVPIISKEFFIEINISAALSLCCRLNSKQTCVSGISLAGKDSLCVGLTNLLFACVVLCRNLG